MGLRMLAVRDHVPALRALAAERAMREDHDLDFVDDVRLAIDEVCSIMLANCSPRDELTLRLLVSPDRVEIDTWVRVPAGEEVSAGGLSLRVLRALANTLDYWVDEADGGSVLRFFFSKSRSRTGPG